MPYQSSNRLADLYLQRGDINAQAAQARGNAWAGAVQNIGQIAAQSLGGYLQHQADAPQRELEGLHLQAARTAADAPRVTAEENTAIGTLLRQAIGEDDHVNRKTFTDLMLANGLGHRVEYALKLLDAADPAPKMTERDPTKDIIDERTGAVVTPGTPRSELHNVPEGSIAINPANPQAGPVFSNPRPPAAPSNPTEAALALRAAAGDKDAQKALDILQARRPAPQGPQPQYMWSQDTDGNVRLMTPQEIRATGAGQAPTADMRNKDRIKATAARAVTAVRTLGSTIITKVGPAQRADAIKRGTEAVFGNDPEFRTYQDSRMALAGTLAVEQQGARVSDADVKALWLPMIPDAYRDTADSYKLKWELIDEMRGATPATGGDDDPLGLFP